MSVDSIRNIEPAKSFLFDLLLIGPVPLPTLPFRVKTTSIPQKATEVLEINYKFSKTKYSGRDSSGHTFSCTFWDDSALSVYRQLNAWQNLQYNPSTGVGSLKSTYSGSAVLVMVNTSDEPIAIFNMNGVWIEDLSEITLDYASSEAVEITVTFSYDKFVLAT